MEQDTAASGKCAAGRALTYFVMGAVLLVSGSANLTESLPATTPAGGGTVARLDAKPPHLKRRVLYLRDGSQRHVGLRVRARIGRARWAGPINTDGAR